jgi:hypothetical protein
VATTIRLFKVGRGPVLLGAMLLSSQGRTIHCTPDLPADVILKVLFRFSKRDEVRGEVAGRDGATYAWHVLGHEADEADETAA